MSEREQNTRVIYTHKHIYVYEFELSTHTSWTGNRWETMQYKLCTNTTGPNHKANRRLLEDMLRLVYKYLPKGVKFIKELQ